MNIKKVILNLTCLLLGVLCIYIFLDYIIYTDKERLSDILDECKASIEEEDLALVMKHVSEQYKDIYGLSRGDLNKLGEGVFDKFEDFKVIIEKQEVTIEAEKAHITLAFRILITYNGQRTFLFGDLNRAASVTLLLEKINDNSWLITGLKELKSRWPIPSPQKFNKNNNDH